MSAPAGAFSVFPLAAAVSAPAGASSAFPHGRSSDCSRRSRYLYFLTTRSSDPLPSGALSVFPHPPQQCLLPQERYLYFLTAAAVLAPAGVFLLPAPSPSPPPPFPNSPMPPRNPHQLFSLSEELGWWRDSGRREIMEVRLLDYL